MGGSTIDAFMPQIVQAIQEVRSDKVGDYLASLRENVCADCHEDKEGICNVRHEIECALDRYFPLIIDAIEEADAQLARSG